MRFQRLRVVAFSTLTIFFASCGGGGQSNIVPSTVQPQAVTQAVSEQSTADASVVADSRSYASIHYVARLLPPNFVPSAIMRNGRIPGSFGKAAAVFHHGHIDTLGIYKGSSTTATFVNDLGVAVGSAVDPTVQDGSRALLFARGTIRDLGNLPAAGPEPYEAFTVNTATVISDTDDIYGYSDFPSDLAFPETVKFFVNRAPVRLIPQFGTSGLLTDINRRGDFAYQKTFGDAPFPPLPAVGHGLSYTFLFGERPGGATSINDRGDIAGYIDPKNESFQDPGVVQDLNWKAFVKHGSALTILPYLSGVMKMQSTGLNNRGDAVGSAGCDFGFPCPGRVFVFNDGKLFDAANLLPSVFSSPVTILPGLSDKGRFVVMKGNSYYLVGPQRDRDNDDDD